MRAKSGRGDCCKAAGSQSSGHAAPGIPTRIGFTRNPAGCEARSQRSKTPEVGGNREVTGSTHDRTTCALMHEGGGVTLGASFGRGGGAMSPRTGEEVGLTAHVGLMNVALFRA